MQFVLVKALRPSQHFFSHPERNPRFLGITSTLQFVHMTVTVVMFDYNFCLMLLPNVT